MGAAREFPAREPLGLERRHPAESRCGVGGDKYTGFNDSHLTEKLVEVEKIGVSRESVRRILRNRATEPAEKTCPEVPHAPANPPALGNDSAATRAVIGGSRVAVPP